MCLCKSDGMPTAVNLICKSIVRLSLHCKKSRGDVVYCNFS